MIKTINGREAEVRKKIEEFQSTGALYHHPALGFYYTEGVKHAVKELFSMQKFLAEIAGEIFNLPENHFVTVKMYGATIEFRNREGYILQQKEVEHPVPLVPGTSFCLYWIGRTLLLPTEY